jgi:hypothetical protein
MDVAAARPVLPLPPLLGGCALADSFLSVAAGGCVRGTAAAAAVDVVVVAPYTPKQHWQKRMPWW